MSEHSQPTLWPETELPSMSFAEGFRAKTLAQADIEQALTAPVVAYGEKSFDWLASYSLASSSWKTSQTFLLENGGLGLAEYSETWPRSGMMRSGHAFQLPTLAYPTQGIGYSLLPTPNATDAYGWTRVSKTRVRHSIWTALKRGGQIRFNYFPQWANFTPSQAATLSEMTMGFPMGWTDLGSAATA